MMNKHHSLIDRIMNFFLRFEQVLTVIVVMIIAIIIAISVIRIIENIYTLFALDFLEPEDITFQDYQLVFGKILTLLISLEFMTSILKVLKTHKIKILTKKVVKINPDAKLADSVQK